MPDQFTETTTKSWGSRIMESIKGIVFGLILFLLSFGLLYWNEGRVDKSEIAKEATPIDAAMIADPSLNNKLVAASGKLSSEETLGDGQYLVPGNYVVVDRVVEMYSWIEESKSESKTNMGGSETTQTTYTYKKDWTSTPASSGNFKTPEGHENPGKPLPDNRGFVQSAKVGNYFVDMRDITLPELSPLPLTEGTVQLSEGAVLQGNQYVFKGTGTGTAPQVGDIRISYKVLRPGIDVMVLGKLSGQKIITYTDTTRDNEKLYRMFDGGDLDSAVGTLATEHSRSTWIFRVLGFVLMWFGLSSIFGPISVVLDVLPIFGSISRGAIGLITFVTSLVLAIVTILVSMLIHNIIAVIIAGLIVLGGGVWWFIQKKKTAKNSIKGSV